MVRGAFGQNASEVELSEQQQAWLAGASHDPPRSGSRLRADRMVR